LRLMSPIQFLMRTCTRDTSLHGVELDADAKVAFGIASANRDAQHFDEPDEFRLDRPDPKHHLAFGGGPHICPVPHWRGSRPASPSSGSSRASAG